MLSLEAAKRLTQDFLERGVIEVFQKSSGVLNRLPFIEVQGSGYSYNVMSELPAGVGYRGIGEAYGNEGMEVDTFVERLVLLGTDSDVDVYLQSTHANFNDLRALQTEQKAKAVAYRFESDFFAGDGKSKNLKGLDARAEEGVVGTVIKGDLTLDALNELIDACEGVNALFMNKKMRRDILKLMQTSNHYIESRQEFGMTIYNYAGVDIVASDQVPNGKIYAIWFDLNGVCGLTNGGIKVRDLGELQTLPVYRTRIDFACGLATKHTKSFAILDTTQPTRVKK